MRSLDFVVGLNKCTHWQRCTFSVSAYDSVYQWHVQQKLCNKFVPNFLELCDVIHSNILDQNPYTKFVFRELGELAYHSKHVTQWFPDWPSIRRTTQHTAVWLVRQQVWDTAILISLIYHKSFSNMHVWVARSREGVLVIKSA